MQFFIDTANLSQIEEAKKMGLIDGVTTNPSLMAKEGIVNHEAVIQHYLKICECAKGDVSAEVLSTDAEGMIKEGLALNKIHPRIVVKIPMIEEGLKAIKFFSEEHIKTNCTLVFSVGQALLAAKAGASYVSPFIGRLDDINQDGLQLIAEIKQVFNNYNFETQILGASIRNVHHIIECAKAGSDVITSPFIHLKNLIKHPLTDSGLKKFLDDYKSREKAQ